MVKKIRVDQLLVDKNMADTLDDARRLVMAGKVLYQGQMVFKPSQKIPDWEGLELVPQPSFVSRGGEKLQALLEAYSISLENSVCADVGASTGGFTDCLLQYGASRVYSIDVGYGLLDWRLRNHPQVKVMERTNARRLKALPETVDFITADVSFISLRKIFPAMAGWYPESGGQAGVLIKPQFEAQREEAARDSGVIRDSVIHRRVLMEVLESAAANGFQVRGVIRSPLLGPAGNQEFLSWMTFNLRDGEVIDLTELINPLF